MDAGDLTKIARDLLKSSKDFETIQAGLEDILDLGSGTSRAVVVEEFRAAAAILGPLKSEMYNIGIKDDLKQMAIRDLSPGDTYTDVRITGTLIEDPIYTPSLTFVIEDNAKDALCVQMEGPVSTYAVSGLRAGQVVEIFSATMSQRNILKIPDERSVRVIPRGPVPENSNPSFPIFRDIFQKAARTIMAQDSANMSVLLSNRSAVFMETNNYPSAAIDAITASYLDPTNSKAIGRSIKALMNMGAHGAAREFLRLGLVYDAADLALPMIPELLSVPDRGGVWWTMSELMLPMEKATGRLVEKGIEYQKKGGVCYKNKDYTGALEAYAQGLRTCSLYEVFEFLCSITTSLHNKKEYSRCIPYIIVAFRINPYNCSELEALKGRLAGCLKSIKASHFYEKLLKVIDYGLVEKAEKVMANTNITEKKLCDIANDPADLSMVINLVKKLEWVQKQGKRMPNGYRLVHVPNIIEEYPKKMGLPEEGSLAQEYMYHIKEAYYNSRLDYTDQLSVPSWGPSDNKMLHRHQPLSAEKYQFIQKAKLGDVYDPYRHRERIEYIGNRIFQSYSNIPERVLKLENGARIIGLGYCDFQLLSIASYPKGDCRIEFIGVDCSPSTTAKFFVIQRMMELDMSSESITEVWYSSCWSRRTELDFNEALDTCLKTPFGSDEVVRYLRKWADEGSVTLERARTRWVESVTDLAGNGLFTLSQAKNVLENCKHVLSGEVMTRNEDPTCGSKVAFLHPGAALDKMLNETPFHTMRGSDIAEAVKTTKSFDKGLAKILMRRVENMKTAVATGRLRLKLMHDQLSPDNTKLLNKIWNIRPTIVTWNNLIDYFHREVIHLMARMISGPGCVHYAMSLNWVKYVHGASVVDYMDAKERTRIYEEAKRANARCWEGRTKAEKQVFVKHKTLHVMNLTDEYLQRKYYNQWSEWFKNGPDRPSRLVAHMEQPEPYHKTTSSVYLEFSFA